MGGAAATRRSLTAAVLGLTALLAGPGAAGQADTAQPRALFVGDSLFVGVGASPVRPVEVRTVTDRLGWRGFVDARSGTGYTTGGRRGKTYLARLRSDGYLSRPYDVIVLEGGTNDAHHGSLSALHDAALRTVDYVHHRQPHARIVLVGAFVAHGVPRHERYAAADLTLSAVAAERGLLYVSQLHYSDVTAAGFLSRDRFHPSDAGYGAMGRDLAAALKG